MRERAGLFDCMQPTGSLDFLTARFNVRPLVHLLHLTAVPRRLTTLDRYYLALCSLAEISQPPLLGGFPLLTSVVQNR